MVPARAQMATTLGFHIILACLGIALPTIVLLAEFIGLRRRDETALLLARRWSQAMGVLVAVGAVTGTVLSFEMGLLWPGLMRRYGAVLGLPFGVEGMFFFLEAIFTAIYLYGWRRLGGWAHFWTGVPIAVSGIFGAMSVIAVNSWMNQPGGFTTGTAGSPRSTPGRCTSTTPRLRDAAHDPRRLYGHRVHRRRGVRGGHPARPPGPLPHTGFALGFVPAAVLTPIQIFVGDTAARAIAPDQPVKFAAMEYVAHTSSHVPEWLGGVYVNGHIYGGLKIPDLDSLLVGFGTGTKVIGWDSVPAADRPPVAWLIHLCFDAMVGLGFLLLLAGLWALYAWWRRRRLPPQRLFWLLGAVSGRGRDRGDGVRLGGHRGRAPALGGLPAAHHGAGGHDERRRDRQPEHRHRVVRGARHSDDLHPADAGPALAPQRRLRGRRSLRPAVRAAGPGSGPDRDMMAAARSGPSSWPRSPSTRCWAGRTSAAASGTCWPAATSGGAAAAADRRVDHPGVGGEPRLAGLRLWSSSGRPSPTRSPR